MDDGEIELLSRVIEIDWKSFVSLFIEGVRRRGRSYIGFGFKTIS